MPLQTLRDVETALRPYQTIAAHTMAKDITLDRTARLMAHIGNPERKLKVIHVAGTSGKTSTTYYIATLLQKTGAKIGYTVSPHIDSLAERVQINGRPLSEEKFCTYMEEYLGLIQNAPETPTYFECLIGFTLWVFAEKERVEYAVLETGLGGLHDSTNVTARSDKVCVLTDIGFDHMEVLGHTLEKIAYQKAGIIHEGNTALMYEQTPEIMHTVRYWTTQQKDAELLTFQQEKLETVYAGAFVPGLPHYQKRNWLLAWAVYRWVAKRDKLPDISATELQKIQSLQVPGRMDIRVVAGRTIIMDGAHNGQKMMAFWQSFVRQRPRTKPVVLLALKEGKEIHDIAPLLKKHALSVIVTSFAQTQDLPVRSILPEDIATILRASSIPCQVLPSQTEAYHMFLQEVKEVGVITGSFYLIAQLRVQFQELR